MAQVPVSKMQVCVYTKPGRHRKYFADIVPNPLPNVGDFISTKHLVYYTIDDKAPSQLEEHKNEDVLVLIQTRTFVLTKDNTWLVQVVGTLAE